MPTKLIALLVAIVIAVVVTLVFWPVTRGEILNWDDRFHLTDNPFIQTDSPNRFLHFWTRQHGNLYIPIAYNAWALIYESSLDDRDVPRAAILHAANMIVHALNACLVFVLLWRLTHPVDEGRPENESGSAGSQRMVNVVAAALAALFFAFHPLQVEAVAWISEFRGLSSAWFGLLAMIAYCESALRPRLRWLNFAGLVCLGCALLCKPAAAAIPLMLVAVDRFWLGRSWRAIRWSVAPWIFLCVASLVMMRMLQGDRGLIEHAPLWIRPFVAGDAIAFYLGKLIWPFNLSADYSRTPQVAMTSGPFFWLAWLVPCALSAFTAWLRRPKLLACLLLMLLALAPVLGFVPFDYQLISTVADRYMYLALIGPALAITLLLSRFPRSSTIAGCVVIIALLIALLPSQIRTWRSDQTIWTHAFEVNGRSVVARANLAARLVESGNLVQGKSRYLELIDIAPNRANGYLGLADLAMRAGDLIEAEKMFRIASEVEPINTMASSRLGSVLIDLKRPDEAEALLKRSIESNPQNSDAMVNLGALLLTQRRFAESASVLERAIIEHPRHPFAWANLIRLRRATHEDGLADVLIADVTRLTDGDPWALRVLARECLMKREWRDAETLARAALVHYPRHAETINDLAQSLAFQNMLDAAIVEFDRASKLRPDLTVIGDNLEKARALKARGASVTTQSTSNPTR